MSHLVKLAPTQKLENLELIKKASVHLGYEYAADVVVEDYYKSKIDSRHALILTSSKDNLRRRISMTSTPDKGYQFETDWMYVRGGQKQFLQDISVSYAKEAIIETASLYNLTLGEEVFNKETEEIQVSATVPVSAY